MQWLLIILLIAACYLLVTRRVSFRISEGFKEEKVLLDELDLGNAAEPTIRDQLMEKAPMFLEDQLDIFKQTRGIYERIIRIAAAALATDAGVVLNGENDNAGLQPFVESAITSIARDAGETPRFCSKSQLDAALGTPASAGLERLYECMPASPGKYLLLLSYASKLLKEQLQSAAAIGVDTNVPDADLPIEPAAEAAKQVKKAAASMEGFVDSRANSAYVSAYALKAPEREKVTAAAAQADADPRTQTPNSSFDNQLEAWKRAFDPESTKRIRQYLRYCNNVFKKLDTMKADAASGSLLMRMDKTAATDAAKAIVAAQTQQQGLPAMNIPL
jgi:hypothetical protein